VVRLQKAMKQRLYLLGDQTFDRQLTQLRKMGRITGFESQMAHHFIQKVKPSPRLSVSFRLPSRSAHSI